MRACEFREWRQRIHLKSQKQTRERKCVKARALSNLADYVYVIMLTKQRMLINDNHDCLLQSTSLPVLTARFLHGSAVYWLEATIAILSHTMNCFDQRHA
jgi:hypothetical protein